MIKALFLGMSLFRKSNTKLLFFLLLTSLRTLGQSSISDSIRLCIESSKFEEANTLSNRHLPRYLKMKPSLERFDFFFESGEAFHYKGKYSIAQFYYDKSLEDAEELKDDKLRFEGLLASAFNYKMQKNYTESILLLSQAEFLDISNENRFELNTHLADLHTLNLDPTRGLLLLENAIKNLSIDDSLLIVLNREKQGFALIELEEFTSALNIAFSNERYFQRTDDLEGLITNNLLFTLAYNGANEFEKALHKAQNSIDSILNSKDYRELQTYYEQAVIASIGLMQEGKSLELTNLYRKHAIELNDPAQDVVFGQINILRARAFLLQDSIIYWQSYYANSLEAQNIRLKKQAIEESKKIALITNLEKELEKSRTQSSTLTHSLKESSNLLITTSITAGIGLIILVLILYGISRSKRKISTQNQTLKDELIAISNNIGSHEFQRQNLQSKNLEEIKNLQILTHDQWIEFEQKFRQLFPQFKSKINQLSIKLTEGDIRYLYLLKLEFSNKEMASTLGVSLGAIRVTKHRIKKKLSIQEDDQILLVIESQS